MCQSRFVSVGLARDDLLRAARLSGNIVGSGGDVAAF
jgi:hypothetical protein